MTDRELIYLLTEEVKRLRKENLELTKKLNEIIEWKEKARGGREPKIKPETRELIRRRYETEDITYQELGEEYGVTRSAICRIIKEKHKNK